MSKVQLLMARGHEIGLCPSTCSRGVSRCGRAGNVPALLDAVIPNVEYRDHQCIAGRPSPAEFVINTSAACILTAWFRTKRRGSRGGILRARFRTEYRWGVRNSCADHTWITKMWLW